MQPPLFDTALIRNRRARAAPRFGGYDFLARDAAARIAERLEDIKKRFERILILGPWQGLIADSVLGLHPQAQIIQADDTPAMGAEILCDLEALPFAPGRFDAVLCTGLLHRVNDVPGLLAQCARLLEPDGLFLALFPGGRSLHELREALQEAELRISGGASPRVHPMIDVKDGGALLQRAQLALPVADSDTLTVRYKNPFALFRDLRGLGETNALAERSRRIPPRALFPEAARLYAERRTGADGRIPATLEWIALTGWKPHESQPKALKPGSGEVNLGKLWQS